MSKSTDEIRQTFLDFFHSKGHQVVASSTLLPGNDPTLLFTNAGMNQFKNVFLGLDNRSYSRAATAQRCVRAGGKHNDLENVGYTARHHTFFEMLGNFSFGDYFKHDAIRFAWELLTGEQWFNLPKEKFCVTVYVNDNQAYNIWANEVGIPTERIIRIGDNKGSAYASDNFWQMGDTGPCGPCSEIFYDHGKHIWGGPPGSPEENGDRYIEIWNLVFMQFNRQVDGTLLPLPKPSVDTGMGLERIAAILQHVNSNYDIDLFKKLIAATARITDTSNLDNKSLHVIADHIRSCAFLISDGVVPSNEGRGYVLRRIIRRAISHGNMLGTSNTFFYKLIVPLIEVMGNAASQLQPQQLIIEQVLRAEEEKFACTLKRGLTLLDEELAKLTGNILDGETAFKLYDTYGFQLDLTSSICRKRNLKVDEAGFKRAMEAQRKRARKSRAFSAYYDNSLKYLDETTRFLGYEKLEHQGRVIALFRDGQPVEIIRQGEDVVVLLDETPFYGESGGQVGDQGEIKAASCMFKVANTEKYGKVFGHLGKLIYGELKLGAQVAAKVNSIRRKRIQLNHSATHLLHAVLRQVLGEHVWQKGSLVNDQYLRFDFSHFETINPKQIRQVEYIVNEKIRDNLPIQTNIMALDDALKKGAIALFEEKYEAQVRVLSISDFSTELCCGTHANRTGDIGLFRIISESSTATGIRRIEAVTGEGALVSLYQQSDLVHHIAQLLKGDSQTLVDKVRKLQMRYRQLEKDLEQLKTKQTAQDSASLIRNVRNVNGVKVLVNQLDSVEPKMLRIMVDNLKNQLGSAVIVLVTVVDGKVSLTAGVTKDLTYRIKANDIVGYFVQQVGGKGGGRPDLAHAGSNNVTLLSTTLARVYTMLATKL